MSRRVAAGARKKGGRKVTLLWIALMAAVIVGLLIFEQTALLYVLATLGVTVLLVIVAMADLEGTRKSAAGAPLTPDDAAAIGSGITPGTPDTATRPTARRKA